MTVELDWQPASGYGVCSTAITNGMLFRTYKLKTGYYAFAVERLSNSKQPPKIIYDSRTDAFQEKTVNAQRIKDVAERWLRIYEGQR